jgi:N-acetylmuramoyl-L-alanine amidase
VRIRVLCLVVLLAIPFHVQAHGYVVRAGDTLTTIAQRYKVSVNAIARLNGIANVNLVQIGRLLSIPQIARNFNYRVQWGDTLIGLGSRFGLTIGAIRALNPSLGVYPLAGEVLRLCNPCGSSPSSVSIAPSTTSSAATYAVAPGDSLISVATHFGITTGTLMAANHIADPNHIYIGQRLVVPVVGGAGYDPWAARSLITTYAHVYGMDPALPLAIGWQESGFNQTVVSSTGAIGVMQVEPYTADHIANLWGRPVHLYLLDDNVHAGVFWLSRLLTYYGGDVRLAIAAYYQGTRSISRVGFYDDTKQYLANVTSLMSTFSG